MKIKLLLLLNLTTFSLIHPLHSLTLLYDQKDVEMHALVYVSDLPTRASHSAIILEHSKLSILPPATLSQSLPTLSTLSLSLHTFLILRSQTAAHVFHLNPHILATPLLPRTPLPFNSCENNATPPPLL